MTERSMPWDGTVTGDASGIAPYDAATEQAKIYSSLSGGDSLPDMGGVFGGVLNELAMTGGSGQVSIASGRAMVWGTWYENDSALVVAFPTPSGSTRIDRLVLQKTWAAQTVRIARIPGAEGGSAPSLTQNAGVVWEVPLGRVSVTTGGTLTVTDDRDFLTMGGGGGGTDHQQDPVMLALW